MPEPSHLAEIDKFVNEELELYAVGNVLTDDCGLLCRRHVAGEPT